MKIGVWMYAYLPKIGGAQISAHCLANSLAAIGHHVTVYAADYLLRQCVEKGWSFRYDTRPIGPLPFRLQRWLGPGGRWAAGRLLARAVARDRLDVVQIVGAWPWIPLAPHVRSATGARMALRSAGDDIQVDDAIGYGVLRDDRARRRLAEGLTGIDLGIAISETVAREYAALGMPEERVRVIPPGVDLAAFRDGDVDRAAVRARWRLPDDRRLVISVGRNHPKKGFADLVRALPALNEKRDAFAVAIVGKGVEALRSVAAEVAAADAFYPIPELASRPEVGGTFPSRELIELYRAADYFVLPSHLETYANVALEAMAAGAPVVVADAPGSRDTVKDLENGLIVPVGRPADIAAAVLRLEQDPALRERLVAGGLRTAESQDWDEIARQYVAAYESLGQTR